MNKTWLVVLLIVVLALGLFWYANRDAGVMDDNVQVEETTETGDMDESTATGEMDGDASGSIELDASTE